MVREARERQSVRERGVEREGGWGGVGNRDKYKDRKREIMEERRKKDKTQGRQLKKETKQAPSPSRLEREIYKAVEKNRAWTRSVPEIKP